MVFEPPAQDWVCTELIYSHLQGWEGLPLQAWVWLWPVMHGAGRILDHKMSVLSQLPRNGQSPDSHASPDAGRAECSEELTVLDNISS